MSSQSYYLQILIAAVIISVTLPANAVTVSTTTPNSNLELTLPVACATHMPWGHTDCTLTHNSTQSVIEFDNQAFDHTIHYSFVCNGNALDLEWVTDNGFTLPVNVTSEENPGPTQSLTIGSPSMLYLRSRDPDFTAWATVEKPCAVLIHSVEHSPTFTTLRTWQKMATETLRVYQSVNK